MPDAPAVLGMVLDVGEDDAVHSIQPLSAVVMVKALNEDGEVCYLNRATPGLTTVEALAMVRYTQLILEHSLVAELGEE